MYIFPEKGQKLVVSLRNTRCISASCNGFGLILNLNSFIFQLEHLDPTTPHLRQFH